MYLVHKDKSLTTPMTAHTLFPVKSARRRCAGSDQVRDLFVGSKVQWYTYRAENGRRSEDETKGCVAKRHSNGPRVETS